MGVNPVRTHLLTLSELRRYLEPTRDWDKDHVASLTWMDFDIEARWPLKTATPVLLNVNESATNMVKVKGQGCLNFKQHVMKYTELADLVRKEPLEVSRAATFLLHLEILRQQFVLPAAQTEGHQGEDEGVHDADDG